MLDRLEKIRRRARSIAAGSRGRALRFSMGNEDGSLEKAVIYGPPTAPMLTERREANYRKHNLLTGRGNSLENLTVAQKRSLRKRAHRDVGTVTG